VNSKTQYELRICPEGRTESLVLRDVTRGAMVGVERIVVLAEE
jgi:hypothetical protein